MGTKNYYEILGVGRDADDEAVKQAFREQAKNCHPDRNPGDQHAEHQFKLVNTAYEGLKDAERREAYLEWLEFADKREKSKKMQWTRLSVLALLLGVAPAVVLYWVIWGASVNKHPQTPVAVAQTSSPPVDRAATGGANQNNAMASVPETGGSSETVVEIKRSQKQAKKTSQPQTVAALPNFANGTTVEEANAEQNLSTQQTLEQTALSNLTTPADARGKQFADCKKCPKMTVLREEVQKKTVQFGFERLPIAVSSNEISVKEWEACAADGGCAHYTRPSSDVEGASAVQDISLPEALAYVAWLSRKTGKAYRLVTPPLNDATVNGDGEAPVVAKVKDPKCEKKTGWEWLNEKEGGGGDKTNDCPPNPAPKAEGIPDGKGFRVARVLVTWASQ
ncbi:MAG: DnaJ domain-containing protein [Alphaproteobacteria bacterium]